MRKEQRQYEGTEVFTELLLEPWDVRKAAKCDVCVDMRVRDERRTIEAAVRSIIPVAKRIIITDTGSTDGTLEILRKLAKEFREIELIEEQHPDLTGWSSDSQQQPKYRPLTDIRQRIIDGAKEEWIWVVDGDEVYTPLMLKYITSALNSCQADVRCIFLPARWVSGQTTIATAMEPAGGWSMGRLFRRKGLRVDGAFMGEQHVYVDGSATEQLWYGSRTSAVLRSPGFYHYHLIVRHKRRTVLKEKEDLGIPLVGGWKPLPDDSADVPDVTAHMMVRDEYPTAFFGLMSILPAVKKAIVVDTGSTDGTLQILRKVRDAYPDKVELWEFDLPDLTQWSFFRHTRPCAELGQVRKHMADWTDTEYIWLIDGDEVYRDKTVKLVKDYLNAGMPDGINVAFVPLLWFAVDTTHLAETNPGTYGYTGRLFRTTGMEIKGAFPGEMASYDGEVIGPDSRQAQLLHSFPPFHHFEMVTKPWRRQLIQAPAYEGPQPEVFARFSFEGTV